MTSTRWLQSGAALCIAGFGISNLASAYELGPISLHGALSATAGFSGQYNYLGDTKDNIDANVTELIVNGSHRFDMGLRASAQVYLYYLDGYKHLTLDFANVDYSFNSLIGLRLGRNKLPFGLYGDAQDVDVVRPFAYLPLDQYSKTMRPLTTGLDGLMAYGSIPVAKAGSIDYQLGYGWLPDVDEASPFLLDQQAASLSQFKTMRPDDAAVGHFSWSTPLEGLRAVYSLYEARNIEGDGVMRSASQIASAPGDARVVPSLMPPGAWDFAIAGRPSHEKINRKRATYSLEYTKSDWQFAAEYFRLDTRVDMSDPTMQGAVFVHSESYSGLVTWQATKNLQLGSYYAESYANRDDRSGKQTYHVVSPSLGYLKDLDFSAAITVKPWWVVKAEVHFLDGTMNLSARSNGDAAKWSPKWTYFAVKSTVSF